MNIRMVVLATVACCSASLLNMGAASAAVTAAEMSSRVVLSGAAEETFKLRSNTAPTVNVVIAPSAEELAAETRRSMDAKPRPAESATTPATKLPTTKRGVPLRVGAVFPSGSDEILPRWELVIGGGQVTHIRITTRGAKGIRAKLVLPLGLTQGELRVVGSLGDDAQMVPLSAAVNGIIWTPYTDDDTQLVELFTQQQTTGLPIKVEKIAHFERSLWSAINSPTEQGQSLATGIGAAGSCNVNVVCAIADDPVNGAAISERRKSVAVMSFITSDGAALCTGTLINSPTQQNFFLTANHCISTQDEATTLSTMWFFESSNCVGNGTNASRTVNGGAQLVFTNQFVDGTLLRLNFSPPAGSVFSGWNSSPLTANSQIVSLSHPRGDYMKASFGTMLVPGDTSGLIRFSGYDQPMSGITFSRGVIEGGSSGSGLFTLSNGSLQLRGTLYGTTVRNDPEGLSCKNTNEIAAYGRFEYLYPQIAPILNGTAYPADDFPNQPGSSAASLTFDMPKAAKLDYVGDIDSFRVNVTQTGTLYVKSSGNYDLIGGLLDKNGKTLSLNRRTILATNDDADIGSNDFGISWQVTPGEYFLNVAPWIPTVLTPNGYSVTASFTTATTNYTSLWWAGESESGWGINLNHQGNIIFGTLFTYDAGAGMWLILSRGDLQPDGSYSGKLYRTTGPAFNAAPFTPITAANLTEVGAMRVAFTSSSSGILTYNVGSRTVTKSISKQTFATQPVCGFSGTNRTINDNYQDLWWNPNESGWGINLTHQSDIIFGTLFTYDAAGKGMWLILSRGDLLPRVRATDPDIFAGALYRTTGPNFDAIPFTPITSANLTQVGNMRLEFADGNGERNGNIAKLTYDVNGISVTKNIQRQTFDTFRPNCQKP